MKNKERKILKAIVQSKHNKKYVLSTQHQL